MRSILCLALLLSVCSGCAVLYEKHRYTARFLDENAELGSETAEVLAAPLTIPVGLTALLVDASIINPVLSIPDALDDATIVFNFDTFPLTGFGEIVVFPMRIVTFVAIFVGSEILRILTPVKMLEDFRL